MLNVEKVKYRKRVIRLLYRLTSIFHVPVFYSFNEITKHLLQVGASPDQPDPVMPQVRTAIPFKVNPLLHV